MTQEEFIDNVQKEISASCYIPFEIPETEVARLIKIERNFFYQEYEQSLEEGYVIVKPLAYKTDLFLKKRQIKLPDCVFSVKRLRKTKSNFFSKIQGDMSAGRIVLQNTGALNSDPESITQLVATQSYYSMMQQILTHEITYNFNYNTSNLTILGGKPTGDVVAEIFYTIDDNSLFEDYYFYRWIVAKSKIQLARILGTVKMPLIGDAELDTDSMKSEGIDEIAELKEKIKSMQGTAYFLLSGS